MRGCKETRVFGCRVFVTGGEEVVDLAGFLLRNGFLVAGRNLAGILNKGLQ